LLQKIHQFFVRVLTIIIMTIIIMYNDTETVVVTSLPVEV